MTILIRRLRTALTIGSVGHTGVAGPIEHLAMPTANRVIHSLVCILPLLLVCFVAGCDQFVTGYGETKGGQAVESINGFSALRNSYDQSGNPTGDLHRLTQKTTRSDVIVWIPQSGGSIASDVSDWMHRWLSRGNRTLVFIVPDSGSEVDYWQQASKTAKPAQRLEYRRRSARAVNERLAWRLNRGFVASNGWFKIHPLEHRVSVRQPIGPWADVFDTDAESDSYDSPLQTEFRISVYDEDDEAESMAAGVGYSVGKTGPSSGSWSYDAVTEVHHATTQSRALVRNDNGNIVVAEITSDNWNKSKIIVVGGGSLLTNFAFTRPANRRFADALVRASLSPSQPTLDFESELPTGKQIAFVTTDGGSIPVSDKVSEIPKATGLEFMTTWPINLIAIHALFFGVVACLMMMPNLGRPRTVSYRRNGHFGHHITAVALLMKRSGGRQYAKQSISRYLRRVRGETSGPWVLPEQTPPAVARVAPPANAASTDQKNSPTPQAPPPSW